MASTTQQPASLSTTTAGLTPITPLAHRISIPPYTLFCHLTIFPSTPSQTIGASLSSTSQNITSQPIIIHVTTSEAPTTPLSVFVYALPRPASDQSTAQPVATTLLGGQDSSSQESMELALRLARVLARRTNRPVYVGVTAAGFLGHVDAIEKVSAFVKEKLDR
ncbi:hypothetical protein POJ06DRAFT_256995 [Lipomyces tetrasporus]|uniref:Uncharacterized protein n=1 Tax=Lipomyces tetrasporus TaxID=54092 RepID=A0AAD7QQK6_9ASCO|nr:uncharacterized protein POJ06DRAFT_256995 [Lipomyces tetrasporus]KAJ8099450.1 hypothetical protein POJ06DRAFT_256995 [Lipomyces tetrasporus]